ncbi:hypothetical protein BDN72DRAFT_42473 [Pluteus cervinus]|uniref:Uncharacterized protein n=1 Tax=Pluteus cervinus TaxID=181527 RepID=A0ACD3BGT5_9AGAR|nr:hypothetical protein BDN72DRAFT_42473 [Pluteus cervinus]
MDVAVRRKVRRTQLVCSPFVFMGTHPQSRPNSRPPSPIRHQVSTDGSETSRPFRPRAKVNSSANIVTNRKPSYVSTTSRPSRNGQEVPSPVSTPRPRSPARASPQPRNGGPLSPPIQPKLRNVIQSNLRPRTPDSSPTTPENRHRSFTATTPLSETAKIYDPRPRQPSLSLHHAISFSSFSNSRPASPALSIGPEGPSFEDTSPSTGVRITSRVSVVKSISESLAPSPTQPPLPMARTGSLRHRAPSASSTTSSGPSTLSSTNQPLQAFYPITTAAPAANPYRFQPSRPIVRTASSTYTPQYRDDLHHTSYTRPIAKVDPASIPLPPQSPPASAVSYSSRSSVSRSSLSQGTADSGESQDSSTHQNGHPPLNGNFSSAIDTLLQFSSTVEPRDADISEDSDDDVDVNVDTIHERKVKAAAKSNRKIADLEITNRSLLAINASLETTKNRQAKEIRELKRKLRESRLILPPRKFREVKSSLDHDDTEEEDDEDEDGRSGDGKEEEEEEDNDETYKRIKATLEGLIQFGRTALETKVEIPPVEKPVAKVLSAEEVQTWRSRAEDDDTIGIVIDIEGDKDDVEESTTTNGHGPLSRASSMSSVNRLTQPLNERTSLSRPQSPAILITEPA